MNQKQKQLVVGIFRQLRLGAEEGERLAKLVRPVDVGPTDEEQYLQIAQIKKHVDHLAEMTAQMKDSIDKHVGSQVVSDRAKYPRAKLLSSSKKPS